jgi:hypothetical protein
MATKKTKDKGHGISFVAFVVIFAFSWFSSPTPN